MVLQSFTEFNSYFLFGLKYLELIQPNAIPKMNRRYPRRRGVGETFSGEAQLKKHPVSVSTFCPGADMEYVQSFTQV